MQLNNLKLNTIPPLNPNPYPLIPLNISFLCALAPFLSRHSVNEAGCGIKFVRLCEQNNHKKWKKVEIFVKNMKKLTKTETLQNVSTPSPFPPNPRYFQQLFFGKQTQISEPKSDSNSRNKRYLHQFTPQKSQKKQTQSKPNPNPIISQLFPDPKKPKTTPPRKYLTKTNPNNRKELTN